MSRAGPFVKPAWGEALLVSSAFAVSLFFIGFNVELLCLSLGLLLIWLLRALWGSYEGIVLPADALAATLLLYGGWLGITLLWTPVASISKLTFWWAAAWPLAFWLFLLAPARTALWPRIAVLMLAGGLALAVTGMYQWLVRHEVPSGPFLDQNLYAALLSLMIFPVAGYFLIKLHEGQRRACYFLAAAYFILCLAVAFTKSRGGALAFAGGFAVLAAMTGRRMGWKALALLGVLAVGAFAIANIAWQGGVVERMATLENPYSAGQGRFLIWERSWQMLKEHPWWGIGLGIYPLLWPAYRHPDDGSAGYFAHNDYLQIWLDAGLPGLVLFLAVWVAAARVVRRLQKRTASRPGRLAEMAGLAAGLVTLLANSVFTYNFYVVPTLIVCGLILGRLHGLDEAAERGIVLRPSRLLGRNAYRLIVVLLLLFPLFYFASVGAAAILTDRGVAQANKGNYEAADRSLARAGRFWPEADSILMLHADLYRHILAASPITDAAKRTEIFTGARRMLEESERSNPLRAETFLVHAELLRRNPGLAGERWRELAEGKYARALELNPRYYHARHAYAVHLLSRRQEGRAREVLEEGMRYAYIEREEILPYYGLTAGLRQRAGEAEQARELRRRMMEIVESRRAARLAKPEREKLPLLQLLLKSSQGP
jgi:O-antigen ligase